MYDKGVEKNPKVVFMVSDCAFHVDQNFHMKSFLGCPLEFLPFLL
jgi:hypothetical protein